jgi:hypothetical protein
VAKVVFGLAILMIFCVGLSVGEEREHRRNAAYWGQFTSDAVARSDKSDRN